MNFSLDVFWTTFAHLLALPPFRTVLIWWAKRHPYFHLVGADGSVYMERYWLFNPDIDRFGTKKYPNIPFSVRVHRIMRPDLDRWPHNHPGDFRTVVLKGWYRNRMWLNEWAGVSHYLYRGDTMTLPETEYHQVTAVSEGGVWTMFTMWEPKVKKEGSWGFLVEGVYVPWRKFLKTRDEA